MGHYTHKLHIACAYTLFESQCVCMQYNCMCRFDPIVHMAPSLYSSNTTSYRCSVLGVYFNLTHIRQVLHDLLVVVSSLLSQLSRLLPPSGVGCRGRPLPRIHTSFRHCVMHVYVQLSLNPARPPSHGSLKLTKLQSLTEIEVHISTRFHRLGCVDTWAA